MKGVAVIDAQARKEELAERTGLDVQTVDQRSFNLSFLDQRGGFFRATATGASRMSTTIPLKQLSVRIDERVKLKVTDPRITYFPSDLAQRVSKLTRDAYLVLGKYSFRMSIAEAVLQTSVFRWVPDTAWEMLTDAFEEVQVRLKVTRQEILASYEQYALDFEYDVCNIARTAALRSGMSSDQAQELARSAGNQMMKSFPTKDEIRKIQIELRPCVMLLSSEIETEAGKAALMDVQLNGERERQKLLTDAEKRRVQMRDQELRRQLSNTVDPVEEIVQQFNARVLETVRDLEASIKKNGFVAGASVKAASNLADYFKLMGSLVSNERELEPLIAKLRDYTAGARYGAYDVADIGKVLGSISRLCYDDANDLVNPASAAGVEVVAQDMGQGYSPYEVSDVIEIDA